MQLLLAVIVAAAAGGLDGPIATAPAGIFNGVLENGTKKWLGVPYAEPPVGDLRWRKSIPKPPLVAPLNTKKYSADCAQIGPGWCAQLTHCTVRTWCLMTCPALRRASLGGLIKDCHDFLHGCPNMTWSHATSEDCLYLNVYAPESSTASSPKVPVIVYYPSGAFQWGASNDEESNAYHKARAVGWKNVILVTVNYRTGIFGFLASPGLSARSGDNSSGLFGIHDQTIALKWVQKNIGAFGGDKDRVMIYGESAGATSMSLHLVMEESAGLFHAVAIDSGAFNQWTYRSWGEAMDDYSYISKAIGCDESGNDTACFLSKSTWTLLNVSDAYYGNKTGMTLPHPEAINNTQWGPVVEGNLLPLPPIQMLREGRVYGGAKVPVLLGSNSDEGSTFLSDSVYDERALRVWCNKTFGPSTGVQVAEYYIARMPAVDPAFPDDAHHDWVNTADEIIGDFVMRCPTRDAAIALSQQGHNVFLYDFRHQPGESVNWPSGTHSLGAFHGAEVPFVFHDDFELIGGEVNLSDTMATYWTNMASSGDPNTWSGPTASSTYTPVVSALALADGAIPRPPSDQPTRTLRPKNHTFWWHLEDMDCEPGVEEGNCTNITECRKKCAADPYCGGFNGHSGKQQSKEHMIHHMKYTSCSKSIMESEDNGMYLFVLKDVPQPPPPPPYIQMPTNCSLFAETSHCWNPAVGYKHISINMTAPPKSQHYYGHRSHYKCLNACCEACASDAPRCKQWFVPHPQNGSIPRGMTTCVLVDHAPQEPIRHFSNRTNMTIFPFCIGAQPPAWKPPKQCHSRFKPFSEREIVNWTATVAAAGKAPPTPGHKHWPPETDSTPTRKILLGKTLGECCEACYLDVQETDQNICRTWEMPGYPGNQTCILYRGSNIKFTTVGHTDSNYTGRGARRIDMPLPQPPPPTPCDSPQELMPVKWPKFSKDNDKNIRLDLCNVTIDAELKKDVCIFWDKVFPINASYPPGESFATRRSQAMKRLAVWWRP